MNSDAPSTQDEVQAASRRLGRYVLRFRIAQGGMASVYLAQLTSDVGFQKWVAIKMIHPHIASDPQFVQMFLNEARLAARLEHPNLCTVFDFGEADGRYYLAMEYLHGETLGQFSRNAWRQGQMPFGAAARVLADAARGLHSAHETRQENGANAGVVHRDVSPQNLFVLYTGVAKVVDFGIARSNDATGERTATGILKGKLAYMSPEQIQEHPVDRRTDLWALGVVLWEVTTGQRLFKRPNDATTLMAVLQDKVPAPSTVRGDYPRALEAIVMKALERDPARRYQTGLELARALEAWLASERLPAGSDEVGDLMQSLFADRMAFRDQLLHPGAGGETMDVVAQWGALITESELPPPGSGPASPRKGDRPRPSEFSPIMELSQVKAAPGPGSNRTSSPGLPLGEYSLEIPPPPALPREGQVTLEPLIRPSDVSGRHPARRVRPSSSRVGIAVGAVLGVLLVLAVGVIVTLPSRVHTPQHAGSRSDPEPPAHEPVPGLPLGVPTQSPPTVPMVAPSVAVTHQAPRGAVPLVPPRPVAAAVQHAAVTTAPVGTARPGVRPLHPVAVPVRPTAVDAGLAGRPGFLNLTCEPPAEVFLGAQSLGMSPIVDRPVPPGHYTVRLVPSEGGEPRTVTVDVHPGESVISSYRWR